MVGDAEGRVGETRLGAVRSIRVNHKIKTYEQISYNGERENEQI